MEYFKETKEIILALKKVYKEQNLSYKKVYKMACEELGENAISESTIQRIFKEGSEENPACFRFETTLIPLCNLLLDKSEGATSDLLLRYKKDLIDEYVRQIKELKEENKTIKEHEKAKYAEKLQQETDRYLKSSEFKDHQILLKDQRIDELLAGWREMSATNRELTQTNTRLMHQLMECPLRKQEAEICNE